MEHREIVTEEGSVDEVTLENGQQLTTPNRFPEPGEPDGILIGYPVHIPITLRRSKADKQQIQRAT